MRLSKQFFLFIFFLSIKSALFAQNQPDDVVGYYLTADPFSDAISQVCVYNDGKGAYEGILIWTNDAAGKKYEGLIFLKNLVFNAQENKWENGNIVYPGKPGKFKTYMRFEKDGRLFVRGYWIFSLLGKTVYWTREKDSRNPIVQHPGP